MHQWNSEESETEEDSFLKKGNGSKGGKQRIAYEKEIEKQDQDIDFLTNHVRMIGNLSKQIHSTLIVQAS